MNRELKTSGSRKSLQTSESSEAGKGSFQTTLAFSVYKTAGMLSR